MCCLAIFDKALSWNNVVLIFKGSRDGFGFLREPEWLSAGRNDGVIKRSIHTQEMIGDFILIIQRDSGEQTHHVFW
jgi:hypothetical protein